MKKGQVFAMDLVSAYGIFMLIMIFITTMSVWVAVTITEKEEVDAMSARAIAGLDYVCYGDGFADGPYNLRKAPVDTFFGLGTQGVREALNPVWNYSLELYRLDGTVVHSVGEDAPGGATEVRYNRLVYYDGDRAKLEMGVWVER